MKKPNTMQMASIAAASLLVATLGVAPLFRHALLHKSWTGPR